MGTINPDFEQAQVFAVLPEKVRQTADLYLDGLINFWQARRGSKCRSTFLSQQ